MRLAGGREEGGGSAADDRDSDGRPQSDGASLGGVGVVATDASVAVGRVGQLGAGDRLQRAAGAVRGRSGARLHAVQPRFLREQLPHPARRIRVSREWKDSAPTTS